MNKLEAKKGESKREREHHLHVLQLGSIPRVDGTSFGIKRGRSMAGRLVFGMEGEMVGQRKRSGSGI
jgi:hypothetical protein